MSYIQIINCDGPRDTGEVCLIIPSTALPAFLELLSRGCNTWQQMPKEIRELKDALMPPSEVRYIGGTDAS